MLEKNISGRRPAYREYSRRTNAFFPGRPRLGNGNRDETDLVNGG
jgi:steroid 5-alpha reductase family enzyme